MSSCLHCGFLPKLQERGKLLLYTQDLNQTNLLIEVLQKFYSVQPEENLVKIFYSSFKELESIIDFIKSHTTNTHHLYGSWKSLNEDENISFPTMTPFSNLEERIKNRTLLKIINEGLFTQFIQPIISLKGSKSIIGYEFLTRPINDENQFYPSELFAFSQRAGLQSLLDSQARISAIELSSKLVPDGVKRFINFLPSSIYDPHHCLKSTFQAANSYQVNPADLIFEVVETEKIKDIEHLKSIFQVYQQHGIQVALDDLGAGYSTLEVLRHLKPNYAKIDRHIIDQCDLDEKKQTRLKEIQGLANDYNITLLAEGIERKEELDFCESIGIDLAQGYFIGKPSPKPVNM